VERKGIFTGGKAMSIKIGVVADDFTGGSDVASFIAKTGLKTILSSGLPYTPESVSKTDALVIALKTRSIAPDEAVKQSLEAFKFLKASKAEKLYFKYCSTFDSTPRGNIGPVADAVLEAFNIPYTVLCPSLPVNGRTVKNGILSVNGVPLAESPMKNHPLNPMWASAIAELMAKQSRYPCFTIKKEILYGDKAYKDGLIEGIQRCLENVAGILHFYLVPDYESDADAGRIAEVFSDLLFLTGGSGLLEFLTKNVSASPVQDFEKAPAMLQQSQASSPALLVSGSCSEQTGRQVRAGLNSGRPAIALDANALLKGEQSPDIIWNKVKETEDPVLVYSNGALNKEDRGGEDASTIIEKSLAVVSRLAWDNGFRRIISAGGETSGAVTSALGLGLFYIGKSVAPGVPVMIPVEEPEARLVLKSGNFGDENFFARALEMTL
jgi:uncharacterized protein YgbK (DUF1537 family)